MESKLLFIRWLASIVFWLGSVLYSSVPLFWFAIHPFAARWRRLRHSPYLWLLPLWAAAISAVAWAAWPWHGQQLFSSLWGHAPAVIFFAVGLRIYRRAASDFGARTFRGEPELRPAGHEQRLITTGMHARMRHPIYFAHLCNLAGCAFGSGLLVPFILLGISALITFPLMIWLEERELEKRFGDQYHQYKKTVPLLPRFFMNKNPASGAPGLMGSRREV